MNLRRYFLRSFSFFISLFIASHTFATDFETVLPMPNDASYRIKVNDNGQGDIWYTAKGEAEKHVWHGAITQLPVMADKKPQDPPKGIVFGNILLKLEEIVPILLDGKRHLLLPRGAIGFFPNPSSSAHILYHPNLLSYQQDEFILYSIKIKDSQKDVTAIMRIADGKTVILARKSFDKFVVSSGEIVSVENIDRKVSLKHFDLESQFTLPSNSNNNSSTRDALDMYFSDFRQDAEKAPPLVLPSDKEATDALISDFISKKQTKALVILGASGCGKTTLIMEVIKRLPPTWRIIGVEPTSFAGTSDTGMFEERIKAMQEASKKAPVVWIFDEMHSLRGQGTHSKNSNDIFEFLKRDIALGNMMIIGTDTPEQYNDSFAGDSAITDRFTIYLRLPLCDDDVLINLKSWLQFFGHQPPDDLVLRRTMELAKTFKNFQAEPRRSIQLLEHTYALIKRKNQNEAQASPEDVEYAATDLYKLEVALFKRDALCNKVKKLQEKLDRQIVGLHTAKSQLIRLAKGALLEANSENGLCASILLFGPPGSGKTSLAAGFAKAMDYPFVRIEMNQFDGWKMTGQDLLAAITDAVRKNPFTVINFDELEKASILVQHVLLAVLDSAQFTAKEWADSSRSRSRLVNVSCRYAFLVFTTNAGGDWLNQEKHRDKSLSPKQLVNFKNAAYKASISAPLLDRMKAIVPVPSATNECQFKDIIKLHVERKFANFSKEHKNKIVFNDKLKESYLEYLAKLYFDANNSNRETMKLIDQYFTDVLTDAYISDNYSEHKAIKIICVDDGDHKNLKYQFVVSKSQ